MIVPPDAFPSNEKSPPAVDRFSNSSMSHSSAPGGALQGRSEWSIRRLIRESEPSVNTLNVAPLSPVISRPPSMRNFGE